LAKSRVIMELRVLMHQQDFRTVLSFEPASEVLVVPTVLS
jgi:hypothetical protein